MKVKITEIQRLSLSDVRSMCCENSLYTRGTNEQYEKMFDMVSALADKQIITGADLYPIALDILQHSRDRAGCGFYHVGPWQEDRPYLRR